MSTAVHEVKKPSDIMSSIGLPNAHISWSPIPRYWLGKPSDMPESATLTLLIRITPRRMGGSCHKESREYYQPLQLLAFVTVIAMQSPITLGLHCAELEVALARDERVWRTLASRNGSLDCGIYNSCTMPLTSWPSFVLLLFKPVIHWLFGLAFATDLCSGLIMFVPQSVYLSIVWGLFVLLCLAVAFWRPRGPLPASYGHIQTMADIVDVLSPKMYWGDKSPQQQGASSNVRHAGTSDTPLPRVHMDALYAG